MRNPDYLSYGDTNEDALNLRLSASAGFRLCRLAVFVRDAWRLRVIGDPNLNVSAFLELYIITILIEQRIFDPEFSILEIGALDSNLYLLFLCIIRTS
jgi:hypothetical protein